MGTTAVGLCWRVITFLLLAACVPPRGTDRTAPPSSTADAPDPYALPANAPPVTPERRAECAAAVDTLARGAERPTDQRVDLPPDFNTWQNDSLLVRAVAEPARSLTLGFKDPEDPHVWETGVLPATRAESIRRGMQVICEWGGEIYHVYRPKGPISMIAVRLENAHLAPFVRDLPMVDYVEPGAVVPIID